MKLNPNLGIPEKLGKQHNKIQRILVGKNSMATVLHLGGLSRLPFTSDSVTGRDVDIKWLLDRIEGWWFLVFFVLKAILFKYL